MKFKAFLSYSHACDRKTARAGATPVPEPETYALMLAGLDGMGWAWWLVAASQA